MNKQLRWGIILQYMQIALNMIIKIIYTPIMLKILGQTEYGLYNLASSIISYLSLLSLGFGAGYIRFYAKYKANNDEESIKRLNGMYMIVFSIIAGVALVAGTFLSVNARLMFNETYTAADIEIAKKLMMLLTVNLAITFINSVFVSFTTSQEKFIFQKVLNVLSTVLSPVLSILLLFLGYGSVGLIVVTTLLTVVTLIVNIYYCTAKLKMKFKFKSFDKSVIKEIFVFSIFIAINQLIDQLNMQTDKIILGKMINASAVAVYAVGATIYSIYLQFSTSISSVFAPKIHSIINEESAEEEKNKKITDLFCKVGRMQYFILMLIMTGFIFFGQYFIRIWAGSGYEVTYYLVIILMVPCTVPLIQNIGIEVQRAKNKHQFRSIVYLIIAIVNVVVSIFLCKLWGIVGVTVGTAISNIIGTIIIMNIYYHKKIGINVIRFWKSILRASLGLVVPVVFGVIVMKFIHFNNPWIYLCYIAVYSIIYLASVYLLGMDQEEKMFIKKVFKKLNSLISKICALVLRPYFKLLTKFPKKRVVFISFVGTQYSDNPKAVSEYMHEHYPEVKQVFLISKYKELKDKVPNYVKCVKMTTFKKHYYMASSKVVVDNDFLAYSNSKKILKSDKQLFIETWHGDRGFKKCFKCANNGEYNYKFAAEDGKIDYYLTGSTYAEKNAWDMFRYEGKFLKIGCPRNDVFFNKKQEAENEVKKKLEIDSKTKILLYAPTYKSYQDLERLEQIDFDKVIETLEKKTKQNWVVVYRTHHSERFTKNTEKYKDGRHLFNDMADLLPYVDMLITDYSSCAGDFLLSGKGVVLYLNDYSDYEKDDVGVGFDIEKTPYLQAKNNKELIKILESNSEKDYNKNCKDTLGFYGCYEDGSASEKTTEIIIKFLKGE